MKKLNQSPNPSPDDSEFWENFTGGIKKIKQPAEVPQKPIIIKEVAPTIRMNEVYQGESLTYLSEGNLDDMDGATARKFKRGDFRIEDELDLHGYTEDKAYHAVNAFIKNAYLQGKRAVLIVTGKGLPHVDRDDIFTYKGLLKERVPQWLNTPELRPLILSFRHPDVKLGGSGALYILLRRKR